MSKANRASRGFTLIEMMLVVFISLIMIVMAVPIFNVSIKTVKVVERKLAVHEASRMALDMVDEILQGIVFDPRGNHFSLRRKSYPSSDPITIPGAQPYYQSLRRMDSANFLTLPSAKFDDPIPGGFLIPCYYANTPMLRSCTVGWRPDVMFMQVLGSFQRTAYRTASIDSAVDNSLLQFVNTYSTTPASPKYPLNALGPGREYYAKDSITGGGLPKSDVRPFYAIDVAFDYWDDVERKFKELADNEACYFAPPPKAIRATLSFVVVHYDKVAEGVSVRTPAKSSRMTVSRILWLPTAGGDGVVAGTAINYTDPMPYNKHIDLSQADPAIFTAKITGEP
jgi:prepilin-type N-terminal cleavage/methylation domain-containing protein